MKKFLNKFMVVFLVVTAATSCKKITDDINVNPNQPSVLSTGYAFNGALQYLGGTGGGGATTNINSFAGELYSQYLSETFYTNESRFALAQYDYQGYYTGPIADLNQVIRFNTDPAYKDQVTTTNFGSNANQIAAARILRAFIFLTITDRWGDIPYSQALQGLNTLNPKFDAQKDIYTDLFKELTEAQAQFDGGGFFNDLLFDGDVTKWKHWANSLRAVMALRLSEVDPNTGSAEFKKAVADGLMTSNDDNAAYKYAAEQNNENPYFGNYRNRYDYAVSDQLVNRLKALNDPRLPVYAEVADNGEYVGLPYATAGDDLDQYSIGNRDVAANTIDPGNVSQIGRAYSSQSSPAVWTSYAQILFAQAEAAHRGWIPGGDAAAATFYTQGITASLQQNGISAGNITTYLAQPGVTFNAGNALEQIITQKWIANYLGNGWESWAEYRRTGYPNLVDPVPTALNADKHIPRRQQYPQSENDLNKQNYNEVIARQGPDALSTHVWWDK
ncbi:SusD/RagB family nutrient-binding outer membrane lipoprotein [Mucilaginibacter sp. 14171R-50]|uniref:SusD/RagB family nutrient-binding outer membrane lipoprotein n=1 Tax=Mucilaginibacter sp. 14171R-50 TaxID=2703789 RepID=UPI00138C4EF8|nr:SusD/RagB family nutrient-binding outer membrane lipoprotein [Mucilaginibacter sp. 14171R-50]QHS55559.1 SusD/RagB family nutrient-binding outer membrane lipoprotein [Mucilaginibacter sp. 14171R-50]